MQSLEDRLRTDPGYRRHSASCKDAWRRLLVLRNKPDQCLGTLFDRSVVLQEYSNLCELREARYMAIKREWEAAQ